jgi:hypothetical protein
MNCYDTFDSGQAHCSLNVCIGAIGNDLSPSDRAIRLKDIVVNHYKIRPTIGGWLKISRLAGILRSLNSVASLKKTQEIPATGEFRDQFPVFRHSEWREWPHLPSQV